MTRVTITLSLNDNNVFKVYDTTILYYINKTLLIFFYLLSKLPVLKNAEIEIILNLDTIKYVWELLSLVL